MTNLETPGGDVTDGGLDVVWDPLHEVAAVLVLDVEHLLVHFLHRHPPTEYGSNYNKINILAKGKLGKHSYTFVMQKKSKKRKRVQ